jgi:3'(2'), 5'-bisphosphate nucleotidase
MEFIRHLDEFAVMIGLAVDGVATLGIIYQPTTQKLYYATVGCGAFLIENRTTRLLRVSPESDTHHMAIALSRSHPSSDVNAIQHELGILNSISCGSVGLKTGLICEGRAHLYLNTSRHTCQWDTCAPDIVLREAGGRMTDVFNVPLRYNVAELRNLRGVIASNGARHNQITRKAQAVLAETA